MSTAPAFDVTTRPLASDFEQLFREHSGLVYRTARRVTGCTADAEDVLQTIFLRLLRREVPPDLHNNPKAYLYRAAVNQSLDIVRARQRNVLMGDAEMVEDQAANWTAASGSGRDEEMNKVLLGAIAELGGRAAEVLILRYVHNYSDAEIAKLLGTTRGTVAVSLFRSRARLKKLIRASMGGKQ